MDEMVPQRGIAPRSAGYRPAALLLSYRGNEMAVEVGVAPTPSALTMRWTTIIPLDSEVTLSHGPWNKSGHRE